MTKKRAPARKPQLRVVRKAAKGTARAREHRRGRLGADAEREERIAMEVVVDAYDAAERAMGWYAYLQDQLQCPFIARCIERRAISPLLVGDEVDVVSLAPADECAHEIFVMIRWEHGGLGVPLSQLAAPHADPDTEVAVSDWQYWVRRGIQF